MSGPIIELQNVSKHFSVATGLGRERGVVKAVEQVNLSIASSGTFGLAGESGCGKSTIAKLVLLLEDPTSGRILFKGRDVATLTKAERKQYRRSVQAVFQDPYASLSPRMRVSEIVTEPLIVNDSLSSAALRNRAMELLAMVGLPADAADRFPHEFSGGQRQRIAIARALSLRPDLIVLDEPLSSLDVSVRAQIVNLLRDLQDKLGLAYILISHDLAVLKHMCDDIAIMYLGKMVEIAESDTLYREPLHPYTNALLSAILPPHPDSGRADVPVIGELPSPLSPPPGCHFNPRCPKVMGICSQIVPPLQEVRTEHWSACHLYQEPERIS